MIVKLLRTSPDAEDILNDVGIPNAEPHSSFDFTTKLFLCGTVVSVNSNCN